MPNDFLKSMRNHPAYIGWEEKRLREIEDNYDQSAREPSYPQHRKRDGRRKPRFPWARAM